MMCRVLNARPRCRRLLGGSLLLAGLVALSAQAANPLDNLHFYGANTLRLSHYEASGNNAAGPYPFQGGMLFDEFNLYADHDNSDYDR